MNRYTQEQIEAADSIDLVAYAQSRGYEMEREGNQYKMKDHDSLYMKGNRWYWFSHQIGGKAISFLTQYEGMGFVDAMKTLPVRDVEIVELSVSRGRKVGGYHLMTAQNPVYLFSCQGGQENG